MSEQGVFDRIGSIGRAVSAALSDRAAPFDTSRLDLRDPELVAALLPLFELMKARRAQASTLAREGDEVLEAAALASHADAAVLEEATSEVLLDFAHDEVRQSSQSSPQCAAMVR